MRDFDDNDKLRLAEIHKLFDEAESASTKIEDTIDLGPVLAGINELRYAGRHVLDALVHKNEEKVSYHYHEAVVHCRRSKHDIARAATGYLLSRIKLFQENYKDVPLIEIIPDYPEKRKRINEIRNSLLPIDHNHRDNKADLAMSYFEELYCIHNELMERTPDITQVVGSRKKLMKITMASLVIGILGLAVGIVGILCFVFS